MSSWLVAVVVVVVNDVVVVVVVVGVAVVAVAVVVVVVVVVVAVVKKPFSIKSRGYQRHFGGPWDWAPIIKETTPNPIISNTARSN